MDKTLKSEMKKFVGSLPYWAQHIWSMILKKSEVSDSDIEIAYSYLKEDLDIVKKTATPEILLDVSIHAPKNYKKELVINSIEGVRGVNALSENQTIEFSPNITIIYGSNGSGKSGYVRLLKNMFYAKHKENILPNVYKDDAAKLTNLTNAKLSFKFDGDTDIELNYPEDKEHSIFNQFAVFDGEVAIKHLQERNDFEFGHTELTLFSLYNTALEEIEEKIKKEIDSKTIDNVYSVIFDGESYIKELINSLSANTNLEEFHPHTPFTEDDGEDKKTTDAEHDKLRMEILQTEKSIQYLRNIKNQIVEKKSKLEEINQLFYQSNIDSINNAINECIVKKNTANSEGVKQFKTDKLKNVGGFEWKLFIKSADKFASIQKEEGQFYPELNDNCLLCQQPITDQAINDLIKSYWKYIKSVVEQEAEDAQVYMDKLKKQFNELNLKQFVETDVLTAWLKDNHANDLEVLEQTLNEQDILRNNIISNIEKETVKRQDQIQIDINLIDRIIAIVDKSIMEFEQGEQSVKLSKLLSKKTYLAHKEKLGNIYSDIKKLHDNMIWVEKVNSFSMQKYKTSSTNTEKRLSKQYFNERYIEIFSDERQKLNAKFDIDISGKSEKGISNRKLLLKNRKPSDILSEGEQKVIAIADFLAESMISTINKGIIFDDPVNSLDDKRKGIIAKRLVEEANNRQVIIFTHDLVFFHKLIHHCKHEKFDPKCHSIKSPSNGDIGIIFLDNAPSYGRKYLKTTVAQNNHDKAENIQSEERESLIKAGFSALRTSYEVLVIFELFGGVVQRFEEQVSIGRLDEIYVDNNIVNQIIDNFDVACRYMEGHSHSDKFASEKPTCELLQKEIDKFNALKGELKKLKKENA